MKSNVQNIVSSHRRILLHLISLRFLSLIPRFLKSTCALFKSLADTRVPFLLNDSLLFRISKKRLSSIVFVFTAVGLLGGVACAGTIETIAPSKDWAWVGSIAAGPVWTKGGETQTFYLAPGIEQTYAARKSTNAFASGELFVGMQKSLASNWFGQFGLAVAMTGNAQLQGDIWDDADPEFSNYSYQYKVRNSRIAAKGKLLLDQGYWVMPWVSASLGVSFNRAYDFTNTPLAVEALADPNFPDHTKVTFAYTLGIGAQRALNDHWQIGVGCEFADFGKSELGRASTQTMNSGLNLNSLYTYAVLFDLTYVA